MFNSLSVQLEATFKRIRGQARITEANISEAIKEIRKALIDADVHYKIAKTFTESVKQKSIGKAVLTSVSPAQMMVKIVEDELIALMGDKDNQINSEGNPCIILLVGLQGSGKTTFAAKLANYLKQKGKSPLLVGVDIYRPAAAEQLKILADSIQVSFFHEAGASALDIAKKGLQMAKSNNKNVVIIDTAGRLAVDENMMREVKELKDALRPQEILFALDALNGQDAVNTAKTFYDTLNYTGIVLTKLDSDTRGGAALTASYTVGVPIKFSSNGERVEQLEVFHADRLARRILGMGDIATLVEKAQHDFDEEKAKKMNKKIKDASFDFNDFRDQLQQIQKMGDIKDTLAMIPGLGNKLNNVNIDNKHFTRMECMINSMTPYERTNPDVLDTSRKNRIAQGSGTPSSELNAFLKQFQQMKTMMKSMNNKSFNPLKMGMGNMFK